MCVLQKQPLQFYAQEKRESWGWGLGRGLVWRQGMGQGLVMVIA